MRPNGLSVTRSGTGQTDVWNCRVLIHCQTGPNTHKFTIPLLNKEKLASSVQICKIEYIDKVEIKQIVIRRCEGIIMKKMIVISILTVILNGCYAWDTNRDNLNKLEVGMTKDKVLEIMGKPYRREAQGQNEWLLYPTEYPIGQESDYLTPLFFEDGKLVGWGKNYWTIQEQRYDVKIDQKIKRD